MTMHPNNKKNFVPAKKQEADEAQMQEGAKRIATEAMKVFDSEEVCREKTTPLIGVQAVADYLRHSTRTVHYWRDIYDDFPVTSEKFSGTWHSSVEELKRWHDRHIDLFISQKQRQAQNEIRTRRKWS